jgi:hypothetical protein
LLSFEGDFAGVIALGNNAEEFVAAHDEERADVAIGHDLNRVKDRRLRRD